MWLKTASTACFSSKTVAVFGTSISVQIEPHKSAKSSEKNETEMEKMWLRSTIVIFIHKIDSLHSPYILLSLAIRSRISFLKPLQEVIVFRNSKPKPHNKNESKFSQFSWRPNNTTDSAMHHMNSIIQLHSGKIQPKFTRTIKDSTIRYRNWREREREERLPKLEPSNLRTESLSGSWGSAE